MNPIKTTTSSRFPLALACYLAICTIIIAAPPRYDTNSAFGSFIDKHYRLTSLPSPKIVLIGGSNVALGINSELLEKILSKPVVNMGFSVTVGLRYMLDEVKSSIKPGDLVVIMPEYDFFCVTNNFETNAHVNGSSELLNLVQVFPRTLPWVVGTYASAPARIFDFLYDCRRLILAKTEHYQRIIKECRESDAPITLDKLFSRNPDMFNHRTVYNKFGDVTVHLDKPSPGLHGMEVICYGHYGFNREGARVLSEFGQFVKAKGAFAILIPPPLPERVYSKWGGRAEDIYQHWKKIGEIEVLGSPKNFVYSEDKFFDTAYHLTAAGREERTLQIADDIEHCSHCSQ
jgi:hypothetical protein